MSHFQFKNSFLCFDCEIELQGNSKTNCELQSKNNFHLSQIKTQFNKRAAKTKQKMRSVCSKNEIFSLEANIFHASPPMYHQTKTFYLAMLYGIE